MLHRKVSYFLLCSIPVVICLISAKEVDIEELDQAETSILSRALAQLVAPQFTDRDHIFGSVGGTSGDLRANTLTGTFRFRRVNGGNEWTSAEQNGQSGWDVSGCYCRDGAACSCSNNPNRVRLFLRAPSGSSGSSGSSSSSGSGGGGQSGGQSDRLQANRNGCLCDSTGCSGDACAQLNGCVCSSNGNCWGAACAARIPTSMLGGGLTTSTVAPLSLPLVNPVTVAPVAPVAVVSRKDRLVVLNKLSLRATNNLVSLQLTAKTETK